MVTTTPSTEAIRYISQLAIPGASGEEGPGEGSHLADADKQAAKIKVKANTFFDSSCLYVLLLGGKKPEETRIKWICTGA